MPAHPATPWHALRGGCSVWVSFSRISQLVEGLGGRQTLRSYRAPFPRNNPKANHNVPSHSCRPVRGLSCPYRYFLNPWWAFLWWSNLILGKPGPTQRCARERHQAPSRAAPKAPQQDVRTFRWQEGQSLPKMPPGAARDCYKHSHAPTMRCWAHKGGEAAGAAQGSKALGARWHPLCPHLPNAQTLLANWAPWWMLCACPRLSHPMPGPTRAHPDSSIPPALTPWAPRRAL